MIVLLRLVLIALVVYGVVVAAVYWGQRKLQYFPVSEIDPKIAEALKVQTIRIKTADGFDNLAWFAPPRNDGGKIIIYFHGNAGNISHRAVRAAIYLKAGYGILLCGYRGYGGNKGDPTEQGFYSDARACIDYATGQGIKPEQMVFYGESIGTGVAVEMARQYQPPRLVLEAPFTSAADIARGNFGFLPVDLLMLDRFDSIDKIRDVKSALLVVHGTRDGVVPYRLGQALYDAANHPKEFVSVEGAGHTNLYDYKIGDKVIDWLGRETGKQ